MPVYFVGFQVTKLMNLHFFSLPSLILQHHCVHLCPHHHPVWVRLNLSIIETVFSLCPPLPYNFHPPFPLFFFLPLFLTAAFHVTAVSRWTAPLTPNAKSGTEQHFELCLSIFLFFLFFKHHWESVMPTYASVLINFLFSQPPGGIPGSQPLLPNSLDPTRPQGKAGRSYRSEQMMGL